MWCVVIFSNKIINSHAWKQLNCAYLFSAFFLPFIPISLLFVDWSVRGVCVCVFVPCAYIIYCCENYIGPRSCVQIENHSKRTTTKNKNITNRCLKHRCENHFCSLLCRKLRKNSTEIVDELFCSVARRRLFHMALRKTVQTNSANLWAVIAENEFKEFNEPFLMFSFLSLSLSLTPPSLSHSQPLLLSAYAFLSALPVRCNSWEWYHKSRNVNWSQSVVMGLSLATAS